MSGVKGTNLGNKNRYRGGRLNPNLSLSGDDKEYFKQQVALELNREPTDREILAKCREVTYQLWKGLREQAKQK